MYGNLYSRTCKLVYWGADMSMATTAECVAFTEAIKRHFTRTQSQTLYVKKKNKLVDLPFLNELFTKHKIVSILKCLRVSYFKVSTRFNGLKASQARVYNGLELLYGNAV
jgi:hypothetical protein